MKSSPTPTVTPEANFRLWRNNDVPLLFVGKVIGHATKVTRDNDCRYEVTLYRTAQGKFIALTCFEANFTHAPECDAEAFDSAKELIAWLSDPASMKLCPVVLEALRSAATRDNAILAAFGKTIP